MDILKVFCTLSVRFRRLSWLVCFFGEVPVDFLGLIQDMYWGPEVLPEHVSRLSGGAPQGRFFFFPSQTLPRRCFSRCVSHPSFLQRLISRCLQDLGETEFLGAAGLNPKSRLGAMLPGPRHLNAQGRKDSYSRQF